MKLRIATLSFLLTLLPCAALAQSLFVEDSLYSPALGSEKHFRILLPSGLEPGKKYPVLYLLHGLYGNFTDWSVLGGVGGAAAPYRFIIVMPDAGNSWYVNAIVNPHARYEDYVMFDLPRYVNSLYPIDTLHEAIAGLSMGGYGAVMMALHFPERFFFAGSLSGAFSVPRDFKIRKTDPGTKESLPNLEQIYGTRPGKFYDDHDILYLLQSERPELCPYFYIAIGTWDEYRPRVPANRKFTDSLRSRGFAYEYHEMPGGHDWKYWAEQIGALLRRMNEVYRNGSRSMASVLAAALDAKGLEGGIALVRSRQKDPRGMYTIDEKEMNNLARRLLEQKRIPESMAVYSLTLETFPLSAGAYVGLGDACVAEGKRDDAIRYYRQALGINPADTSSLAKVKALIINAGAEGR